MTDTDTTITVADLTAERWPDFASLCRRMGGNRGCWCMWWREARGEPRTRTRRESARALVEEGPPPGVVAYDGEGAPVGWCAVAPRAEYPRLNAARDTRPLEGTDSEATWVVSCFFVLPERRGSGVARALLAGAVDLAGRYGASVVEGVPIDRERVERSPSGSYTGSLPLFLGAGFVEVGRWTPKGRVTVRLTPPGTPGAPGPGSRR